ncbi:MAG: hypothetical protein IPI46_08280 [Bacteroidetes bacterium]|nr:hypothetical protein [Bacteroidota bacterium]
MSKKIIVLVCYLLCNLLTNKLVAQTPIIDSLRKALNTNISNKSKQDISLKMCEQYYSLSADSLQRYVTIGLSLSPKNSEAHFQFKNFYCFYYLKLGNASQSILYSDSLLLKIPDTKKNQALRLAITYNKSIGLIRNNQYQEAIQLALQFLEGAEKTKDTLSVLKAYTILGWVNMELDNDHEAVNWLRKGLQYSKNITLISNASSIFNNLASCYETRRQYDSALYFVNQGLRYSMQVENLGNHANALNIRADIYSKTNKIKEAQKDLEDALIIRQKIGDLPYIIADMGQLSRFYASTHQTEKGISIALEGIELAKQSKNISKLIYVYQGLAKNYQEANRSKEQTDVLKNIIILKDSLYLKNSAAAIAEMVTKYELQKKENIIIQQENKLIRNRYFSIGTALAFLLAGIIAWLVYRNYTHIQKRKMQEVLAEEKINTFKAIKLAEEKERKRIAADLHDNLGSYAAAITSNIRYLKEPGHVDMLTTITQLDENAQGIVTQLSDTIWILKNEYLPITKLADRFKLWAQRMMENYPDIAYFYQEDIEDDIELTPVKILNIFLILKECLNNALKHSSCSEIHISIRSNRELEIKIADNGIGISSLTNSQGSGLENVKHRAHECGMKVSWENILPKGTCVNLYMPTTN